MLAALAATRDFCVLTAVNRLVPRRHWNEMVLPISTNEGCDMIIFRVEHNRRRLRMQVQVCESRLERGRGLLLRRRPRTDAALLLPGRRAVHTIGLHYPVDVLFCDGVGRILRIEPELPPCRIVRERRARQVWQLCAGGARHWQWRVGDAIRPC
jgi:uncharacterized membrane protein (UPF0127 family)